MVVLKGSLRRTATRGAGKRLPQSVKQTRHALPRVVFVVGPTSSGKTALGIRLAKVFDGEIVNADARQVYQEVDIGTGKPKGKHIHRGSHDVFVVEDIPHHLMDFLTPDQLYAVAEWRKAAMSAIRASQKRGHVPIVVGGTGLYVSSLVDNYEFPSVPPQPEMRKAYEDKTLAELARILLASDAEAGSVVDLKNKRRVVRALEIISFSGKKVSALRAKSKPLVDAFQVGIQHTKEVLYQRVEATVDRMVEEGLIGEVRMLMDKGISADAPGMTSIGYRDIMRALNGEISEAEAIDLLKRRTRQYTKRQITWFKRDGRIHWVASEEAGVMAVKQWLR